MIDIVLSALGLAVAGLDLVTLAAATGLLTVRRQASAVFTFAIAIVVLPIMMGVALSITVKNAPVAFSHVQIDWYAPWGAVLEVAIVIALLWTVVRRLRTQPVLEDLPTQPQGQASGGLVLALALTSTHLTSPSFWAIIALSARQSTAHIWLVNTIYGVVCQLPLLVFVGCLAITSPDAVIDRFARLRERFRPVIRSGITVAVAVVALLMLADVAVYASSGGKAYLLQ